MAGSWIKLETATPDKPEIAQIAALMGIPVDQALGISVRFWIWLDANLKPGDASRSRNAFITHVSQHSLDNTLHAPGYAQAIAAVGWAEFDADKLTLTIPHAERHNGKPAKTRALTRDRQQAHRNAVVTQALRKGNASVTRNASPDKRVLNTIGVETNKETRASNQTPETAKPNGAQGPETPTPNTGEKWWLTVQGIAAKGIELGIPPTYREEAKHYKARLFLEIEARRNLAESRTEGTQP